VFIVVYDEVFFCDFSQQLQALLFLVCMHTRCESGRHIDIWHEDISFKIRRDTAVIEVEDITERPCLHADVTMPNRWVSPDYQQKHWLR